jgi:dTDP-4-amino-4,6-dideoxygalactose transaminase
MMTSSGTAALVAALAGLGVGPGDEVIVPAHTFMATAVAVLGVGAIPVIVDIDPSIAISPSALESAIGPRTKAAIPVHMWGMPANMDAIMAIAKRRNILILEDACQGVGGAYNGRRLGSIGHAGAFSFNYYKNMTCGEGGAMVTNDARVLQVGKCMIDCNGFFWTGKETDMHPFVASGSRASEIEGAIMNAQLDRIEQMIRTLRDNKKRVLRETANVPGLTPNPANSLDWECATHIVYLLPTATQAQAFATAMNAGIAGKTGRHTYTEWDPILSRRAGHVPAMNPFNWEANKGCRMNYSPDMCSASLDILNRTVMIGNSVDRTEAETTALIHKIRQVAQDVLGAKAATQTAAV